jgi:iron(III) transport system substrate-binding protein
MSVQGSDRRHVIKGLGAAGGLALLGGNAARNPAWAQSRDAIIEAAKKEEGIVWYEAYTRDEGNAILKEFQRAYPFVKKLDFLEVPASQKQARFVQESLAGGPTTDVFLSSSAGLQEFVKQGFVVGGDWAALGIANSDVGVPTPDLIMYATSIFVGVYNPNRVSEADAPKTWEDLVAPRWKGRTGAWSRAVAYTVLSSAWGEQKARDYVRKLAAQQPRLYGGTFQVAQAIAAGEVDVGIGSFDATTRVALKGAPVRMFYLDPTPISLLYGCVAKYGKNPNTARLLLTWLASQEGALAFEKVTHRGNHLVPETNSAKVVAGRNLSFFKAGDEIARSAQLNALENEFAMILQRRG